MPHSVFMDPSGFVKPCGARCTPFFLKIPPASHMRRPAARYLQRMESPLTTARFLRSNTDKAHTCQTVQAGSGGRRQAAHLEPAGPLAAILEPLLLGHGHGGVHVAHRREALFARHPYWGNRACYKTTVHEPASLTAANQRRLGRPGPGPSGAASASPLRRCTDDSFPPCMRPHRPAVLPSAAAPLWRGARAGS